MLLAREQGLGIFLSREPDHFIRQAEDRLRAPVVLLQFEQLRAGKELREIHDIAKCRPAKSVHRLRIVSDSHDVVMRERHFADDFGLQGIGVLVFVDHDVTMDVRDAAAKVLLRLQQLAHADQQIVVVHEQAPPFVGLERSL